MERESDRVRALNQRFYDAVSRQNLLGMEQIWSHATHVRCVHPGWKVIEGWEAIRDSWRRIFQGALCLTVEPEDLHVTVLGPTAVVTCRERISSFTLEGSTMQAAQATNIYEKRAGRWELIHHHASAIKPPAAAPES